MIPFISLYRGSHRVVVNGNRDIHWCRSAHAIIINIIFFSHVCVPWQPIGGIGPNQDTVASTMMYKWSACPWMCQTEAEGANTMTSMSMIRNTMDVQVADGSTLPYGSFVLNPT